MNIERMFNDAQYDQIIALYHDADDVNVLWYVIDAYIQKRMIDAALELLTAKHDIFMRTPKKLMTIHIDLLVEKNDLPKAMAVLEMYEQMPYISYEIEELFPVLKAYIFKQMQPHKAATSLEQKLASKNDDDIIVAINELHTYDIAPFRPYLRKILQDIDISALTKSLVLLLLVSKKEMETYIINKLDFTYELIPYELDPIVASDEIELLVSHATCYKNISMNKALSQIIMRYALLMYPEAIMEPDDQWSLLYACELIVYRAFKEDASKLLKAIAQRKLDEQKIAALAEVISEVIDK